jgi:hypothetical protein
MAVSLAGGGSSPLFYLSIESGAEHLRMLGLLAPGIDDCLGILLGILRCSGVELGVILVFRKTFTIDQEILAVHHILLGLVDVLRLSGRSLLDAEVFEADLCLTAMAQCPECVPKG